MGVSQSHSSAFSTQQLAEIVGYSGRISSASIHTALDKYKAHLATGAIWHNDDQLTVQMATLLTGGNRADLYRFAAMHPGSLYDLIAELASIHSKNNERLVRFILADPKCNMHDACHASFVDFKSCYENSVQLQSITNAYFKHLFIPSSLHVDNTKSLDNSAMIPSSLHLENTKSLDNFAIIPLSLHSQKTKTIVDSAIIPLSLHSQKIKSLDDSAMIDDTSQFVLRAHFESMGISTSGKWDCLFSSVVNGKNWIGLVSKLCIPKSSLLIIKDDSGAVFGAFSSTPYKPSPLFIGDYRCFLLTLAPKLAIFPASGINSNYKYFNFGMRSSDLPNGVGFGGQLNHFGLFLDSSLEHGHCRCGPRSTTYKNTVLGGSAEFAVDAIEVWQVEARSDDEIEAEFDFCRGNLSRREAAALLEMNGTAMYSEVI